MEGMQLTLSTDERGFLGDFLSAALKNLQIEEHRTRTPSFREHITHEKEMVEAILIKLGQVAYVAKK